MIQSVTRPAFQCRCGNIRPYGMTPVTPDNPEPVLYCISDNRAMSHSYIGPAVFDMVYDMTSGDGCNPNKLSDVRFSLRA